MMISEEKLLHILHVPIITLLLLIGFVEIIPMSFVAILIASAGLMTIYSYRGKERIFGLEKAVFALFYYGIIFLMFFILFGGY